MYSCRSGVNQYIEDMEEQSPRETSIISSWDRDYKLLKHLRWGRNRIAHDADDYQISSISDLQDVRGFYERILSGQDPIALLEKSKVAGNRQRENRHAADGEENAQYEYKPAPQTPFALKIWICGGDTDKVKRPKTTRAY